VAVEPAVLVVLLDVPVLRAVGLLVVELAATAGA
jgi:hypothetical protein